MMSLLFLPSFHIFLLHSPSRSAKVLTTIAPESRSAASIVAVGRTSADIPLRIIWVRLTSLQQKSLCYDYMNSCSYPVSCYSDHPGTCPESDGICDTSSPSVSIVNLTTTMGIDDHR